MLRGAKAVTGARSTDIRSIRDSAGMTVRATSGRSVGSLQEHIGVRLFLEEWDMAPPPFGENWEDEAKAVIYLRGALSIDMGSAGRAVERLQLAGGVGNYVIRVFARNRREVDRLYTELYGRGVDPLSDEFQQARTALEGREQYLLQLWREA